MHILLRAPLRAPRRTPVRGGLRKLDPRQDEYRRGSTSRARPNVVEVRGGLPRIGHRPISACRGTLPAHTSVCGRAHRASTPFSIVTRGPLVVRDIDVLQEASSRVGARVYVSIPTLDDRVWRTTEPGTAPPRSRLAAVRRLAEAGIHVGVGIAPILPGLSDLPEQLEAIVREARAAGASNIWASVVHLRPGVREHFLEALGRDWPEEVGRYEALFGSRAYLPATTTSPMTEPVRRAAASTASFRRVAFPSREPAQLSLSI